MPDNQDSGSGFLVGLSTGLLVGTTLAFLFATPQGKKVRKKMMTEWERARHTIAQEVEMPEVASWKWSDVVSGFSYAASVLMDGVAPAVKTQAAPRAAAAQTSEPAEHEARSARKVSPTKPSEPKTQKFKGV